MTKNSENKAEADTPLLLYFPLSRLNPDESIFESNGKGVLSDKYSPIFTPILGKQLALSTYYGNKLIAPANTLITIPLLQIFDKLKINFKVNSVNISVAEKNYALDAALNQIINNKKAFLDNIRNEDIPIIQSNVKSFISNALTKNIISSFQHQYQQIMGYLEFANSVITSDKKYIGTAAALKRLIENEQHIFKLKKDEVGETIEHSLKTAWLSLIMAVELDDFDYVDYEKLSIICMAHDCGKAMIPEEIIYKNGRLSELENDIMKSHVLISYILTSNNQQNLDFEHFLTAMHHIKENKNIPQSYGITHDTHTSFYNYLSSTAKQRVHEIYGETKKYYRLISIADTFEAITAKRVYKKPSSVGKTIEIMINENINGDFFYAPYLDELIQFLIRFFLPKNMIFKISDKIIETHYKNERSILNEKTAYQKMHRGVIVKPSSHIEEPLDCVIFNHRTKKTERILQILPLLLLDDKYI